ncbi:hypothetical protein N9235_02130 [Gammaproteobacteria bacterium]|nr:hypothetical protein [Gammaproteobacteria bacterium]
MKCKNLIGMLTIALSIGAMADASALGLPKFGSSDDSAGTSNVETMDSVMTQQDSLVKTYQSSMGDILSAQALLLEAHDKKEEAAKVASAAEAMGKGTVDKNEFEKTMELSESASEIISMKMGEQVELTSEGRKKYQESLLPYASGIGKMAQLKPELEKFMESASAQVKSASMMGKLKVKGKLDVGMYLATKAPGYFTNVASTTKEILTYANKQGVSEQSTGKVLSALGPL